MPGQPDPTPLGGAPHANHPATSAVRATPYVVDGSPQPITTPGAVSGTPHPH